MRVKVLVKTSEDGDIDVVPTAWTTEMLESPNAAGMTPSARPGLRREAPNAARRRSGDQNET